MCLCKQVEWGGLCSGSWCWGGGVTVVFLSTGIHRSQGGGSGTEEAEGSRVTTGKDQVKIRVLMLEEVFMLSGRFPKSIFVFKRNSSR